MKKWYWMIAGGLLLSACGGNMSRNGWGDELYRRNETAVTRWASPENPQALPGAGGKTNKGAKGQPFLSIEAGDTLTLLDVRGSGIINRIWSTLSDLSPEMLSALRLEIYWDGAETPAVSAPFGDFFCHPMGRMQPFENEFFSSPEGESFNCIMPMPFKTGAKVQVINTSEKKLNNIFYDVDYLMKEHAFDICYLHAYWNRDSTRTLGRDYAILPKVKGNGRFLGTVVGIRLNDQYKDLMWWGEGEVKIYLDGDSSHPTLCGTGAEDYVGSAWGLGTFVNRYQGCLLDGEKDGQVAFYRYHVPDPVYFHTDCRVEIQQIGSDSKDKVLQAMEQGVDLKAVGLASREFLRLREMEDSIASLADPRLPGGWVNFYRYDDYASVAYFYLDRPENELPVIK